MLGGWDCFHPATSGIRSGPVWGFCHSECVVASAVDSAGRIRSLDAEPPGSAHNWSAALPVGWKLLPGALTQNPPTISAVDPGRSCCHSEWAVASLSVSSVLSISLFFPPSRTWPKLQFARSPGTQLWSQARATAVLNRQQQQL